MIKSLNYLNMAVYCLIATSRYFNKPHLHNTMLLQLAVVAYQMLALTLYTAVCVILPDLLWPSRKHIEWGILSPRRISNCKFCQGTDTFFFQIVAFILEYRIV